MRINNNIPALQVFDSVRSANRLVSGSMLRLSSGFRINSARDDAAGLAISNRMLRQMDGLEMAGRNAMDAISMVQTAEGALTEVHNMIQRMRELAVFAATGHLTEEDREMIQDEVDQLLQEIDDISMRTEFNGIKLFGPKANQAAGFSFFGTESRVASRLMSGVRVSDGFPQGDFSGLELRGLRNPAAPAQTTIIVEGFNPVTGVLDPTYGVSSLVFTLAGGGEIPIHSIEIDNDNKTVKVNLDEPRLGEYAIMQLNTRLNAAGTDVEFNIFDPVNGWDWVDVGSINSPPDPNPFNLNITYRDHSDLIIQTGPARGMEMAIRIPQLNSRTLGLAGIDFVDHDSFLPDSGSAVENPIRTLDRALRDVSSARSSLGAYQNRLESTVASLDVTRENTTIALSRIRDTDMAREMTFFTQNSVLSQAGISIMAQANQRPQQILALVGQ